MNLSVCCPLDFSCADFLLLSGLEVPVANGSGSYPFSVDVPRYTRFLFSNRTITPAKAIAKSIVRERLWPSFLLLFDGNVNSS